MTQVTATNVDIIYTTSIDQICVVTRETEKPFKSLSQHLPIERHKSSPYVQFLQRNIDVLTLIDEILRICYFPFDLDETCFDVVGYYKPLGADKMEESLDGYMDL